MVDDENSIECPEALKFRQNDVARGRKADGSRRQQLLSEVETQLSEYGG